VTLTATQVRELLDRHGLSPRKSLGQHFVVDPNTVRRIVVLAGVDAGDHVVEVGAGLGSLTVELAAAGAHVVAIEADDSLIPALREVTDDLDVEVVHADALAVDWEALLADAPTWKLVANLPYNVATPLVVELLDHVPPITELFVMVQREAGERLVADPGGKTYGIPSVKVAYWAHAELVGTVPPTVFLPRPKVESALVRITRRTEPAVAADPERLFALVRQAFGQRRKMLRRSLAGLADDGDFERAGVQPDARPEQLDVEAWGRLTDAIG
jgi:16S rRNA (adenine1518-N6/adenine1519-N6)-dimethyltransferase